MKVQIKREAPMKHPYELVPHTADLKMNAYGVTLEELFTNALRGMFASIKPHGPHITYSGEEPKVTKYTATHKVVVRAPDRELLLVDFLSECLYLSDVHDEAYFDARFHTFNDTELEATIYGTQIDRFEVVEIKAVTYHELTIEKIDQVWRATLVFDI